MEITRPTCGFGYAACDNCRMLMGLSQRYGSERYCSLNCKEAHWQARENLPDQLPTGIPSIPGDTLQECGHVANLLQSLHDQQGKKSIHKNKPSIHALNEELIQYVLDNGGTAHVYVSNRPDGERGLMASRNLKSGERAVWVPDNLVLQQSTVDPAIRAATAKVIADGHHSEMEATVYSKMVNLTAGALLEKAKGKKSNFSAYIDSLPDIAPITLHRFKSKARKAAVEMLQQDIARMYEPLLLILKRSIGYAIESWIRLNKPSPTEKEMTDMFFFALTRISHLRLIPAADLANCGKLGEENCRIIYHDNKGCELVAKEDIKKGTELCIAYHHNDAISMFASYGCSLDLQYIHSVTKLDFKFPDYIEELGISTAPFAKGLQLKETEPIGLAKHQLLCVRMAMIGNKDEVLEALKMGFFQDPPAEHLQDTAKVRRWKKLEDKGLKDLEKQSARALRRWEENIAPLVEPLRKKKDKTGINQMLVHQYATDIRLLRRCVEGIKVLRQQRKNM